jgi:hypothetical protein
MNIKLLPIVTIFLLTFAQVTFADSIEPVSITILSAKTLSGTAGDYVMIKGQITNNTKQSISDITTYMSLVDTQDKLPVDLEDWSAEKGLFIGTIESGQTLPLTWKIHFVKAGTYALIIIADIANDNRPVTSTITRFLINPKKNLNPGQVLPVALGTPILLLFIMSAIQYRRNAKVAR